VELGVTLRQVIFDLAGGMARGKSFKGVQVGGPLGSILPESALDTPLAFEELAARGGILGHAGMVVYTEDDDLVKICRGLMAFCAVESCGKCFPCRIGAVRGTELFDQMMDPEAGGVTPERLELLGDLLETMKVGSLCALGSMTPLPMESLLNHFPEELDRYRLPVEAAFRKWQRDLAEGDSMIARADGMGGAGVGAGRRDCRSRWDGQAVNGTATPVTVEVDGHSLTVEEGTTVLQALRSVGSRVPTLCYSDRMKPYGACRTCLVEVEGRKPVASCHTPVAPGAKYRTRSPFLTKIRRNITELIVSDHPLECLDCTANGRCDLQELAQEVGLRTPRYENPRTHTPPRDDSHPFIKLEMDKCIGCALCVRACDEVQGSFILAMEGRGYDTRVIAGNDTGFEEAKCVSCGQCVFECPVAALEEPGTRAFGLPDTQVTTTCSYCGVGCSLNVNVKDGRVVNIEPNRLGSANTGHTCVKGRFAHQFAHSEDRLTSPLIRQDDGTFREASWDEALDLIARKFTEIRDQHGPQAFSAISSSRCTNEENYLMQKFARVAMGTNSIDNCSRVCHSPSAYALGQALGTGAGTNPFEDVFHSDLIVLVGANPTEAHPVFGAKIKQAVLAGCKLIVLDPRNTELARLADLHLPLRPGSNVAVLNAMQRVLMDEGFLDEDFIRRHSVGFEEMKAELEKYTPEWAAEIAGIDAELIRSAARMYGNGPAPPSSSGGWGSPRRGTAPTPCSP
jgi:NAD-dependent dihydropyrimidine dehydrogenase PreA subunit/aerobic-type carbon monoxide dehydrogenase small subunit (CoxS/CutS family)